MPIDLTERDEFAVITINRPEALNALSFELLRELANVIAQAARGSARALLFIGAGEKAFCAGADVAQLRGRSLMQQRQGAEFGQSVMLAMERISLPSVAVINGLAFGGGLELALACTFRLATRNAKLGLPEIKLGLIPGYGGTQRLPRLIGEGRALEMIMTGRSVDAEEAQRIGLVNRVIDGNPLDAAVAFAREFSGYSLPVLNFAREAVSTAMDHALNMGLRAERELGTLAFQTQDAREGISAFLEKRPAKFQDR